MNLPMKKYRVRLFSHLKYQLGRDFLEIEFSKKMMVQDLEQKIRNVNPEIAEVPFRLAVNHEFVSGTHSVRAEDEIALIPPVQGG